MPDFRYVDPRKLDGSPYQVAKATFDQTIAVGRLYQTALRDAHVFARNAEMERQCEDGGEPNGAAFVHTPLGTMMNSIEILAAGTQKRLGFAAKAAAFDPKAPEVET